jgi:hypothetical protein
MTCSKFLRGMQAGMVLMRNQWRWLEIASKDGRHSWISFILSKYPSEFPIKMENNIITAILLNL